MDCHIPPSSTMKRSIQGKKLQYQERISEQSILPPPTTTTILTPNYLSADSAWRTVATIVSPKLRDGHKRQVENFILSTDFLQKKHLSIKLLFKQRKVII
jgi:hypothetical protein